MRVRSFTGMLWLTWALPLGVALPLALAVRHAPLRALGGESPGQPVGAHAGRTQGSVRAQGNHQVDALVGAHGGELGLKLGFLVRPRVAAQRAPQRLSLRVTERTPAEQIAPGFVPIGPSVELHGEVVRSDVEYRAEAFRVRSGHRLVLAMQKGTPCTAEQACWTLLDAQYADSRCVARNVPSAAQRLQFGSLPLSVR